MLKDSACKQLAKLGFRAANMCMHSGAFYSCALITDGRLTSKLHRVTLKALVCVEQRPEHLHELAWGKHVQRFPGGDRPCGQRRRHCGYKLPRSISIAVSPYALLLSPSPATCSQRLAEFCNCCSRVRWTKRLDQARRPQVLKLLAYSLHRLRDLKPHARARVKARHVN